MTISIPGPFPLTGQYIITTQDGVIAFAGGGIAGATLINANIAAINIAAVTTVATSLDSCILDIASVGSVIAIWNRATNPFQLFANGTDTIDGTPGATGVTVLPGSNGSFSIFTCLTAGAWYAGSFFI